MTACYNRSGQTRPLPSRALQVDRATLSARACVEIFFLRWNLECPRRRGSFLRCRVSTSVWNQLGSDAAFQVSVGRKISSNAAVKAPMEENFSPTQGFPAPLEQILHRLETCTAPTEKIFPPLEACRFRRNNYFMRWKHARLQRKNSASIGEKLSGSGRISSPTEANFCLVRGDWWPRGLHHWRYRFFGGMSLP